MWCRAALDPLDQWFVYAFVGHVHRLRQVLAHPLEQFGETVPCFLFVLHAVAARRGPRHLARTGVKFERRLECLVWPGQPEKDLVGLLLVGEWRWIVGLEHVQVELAGRLSGGTLVGRAEEKVAGPGDPSLAPLDLVLPDAIAGDIGRFCALHGPCQYLKVGTVELALAQALCALLDLGVKVDVLFQVQVILSVVGVERDELAARRARDLTQDDLDRRSEKIRVPLGHRQVDAQSVAQLLRGGAQRGIDIAGGQAVDAEGVDDAQRRRAVLGPGKRVAHPVLEHLALVDHFLDLGDAAEGRVVAQPGPVSIVGDQTRLVGRHVVL